MLDATWLDPRYEIGNVGNNDILIGAITLASLAIFLPASRSSAEVFFENAVGRWAFGGTLLGLVITVGLTAVSMILAFGFLVLSLVVAMILGAWATWRHSKAQELRQDGNSILGRGRPSIRNGQTAPPPHEQRCEAFVASGERCVNRKEAGKQCKTHAKQPPSA